MRACRAAVRGSVDVGLPARGGQARFEPADPRAAGDRGGGPAAHPQLGLQDDAAAGSGRPPRLSAARQGARRQQLDQRDGLHAWPPQRLRRMGGARQSRLVVRRRAAVLPPLGAQRAARRRLSRARRPAQRRRSALALRVHRALARGCGRARAPAQRRFQRRRAGGDRPLPADAEERRALERRGGVSHAQSRPAQSHGADASAGHARRARAKARGRRRIPAGGQDAHGARAPRGDSFRRRAAVAAAPAAVGDRRCGRALGAGHHARRRPSGRGPQPARPRRLRHRLSVASQGPDRIHARRHAERAPQRHPLCPRAARHLHVEHRRGRRLPQDLARARCCPISSSTSASASSKVTAAACTPRAGSRPTSACCGRRAPARSRCAAATR